MNQIILIIIFKLKKSVFNKNNHNCLIKIHKNRDSKQRYKIITKDYFLSQPPLLCKKSKVGDYSQG